MGNACFSTLPVNRLCNSWKLYLEEEKVHACQKPSCTDNCIRISQLILKNIIGIGSALANILLIFYKILKLADTLQYKIAADLCL